MIFYITALAVFIYHIVENINFHSDDDSKVSGKLGCICRILAAIILIYSINRIRKLVNMMENGKITLRERVMTIHTVCYALLIIL